MARHESDREDLLREAIALVERIELASEAPAELVVAGFRAGGALSVYFGADPVYQFNTAHQLRRAYCEGQLLKAVRGRLVSLQRVRGEREVQLLRHELTDAEQAAVVAEMQERLRKLAAQLESGGLRVVGQVPDCADVRARLADWLTRHDGLPVAKTPHVLAAAREHCG